ncbi:MULTISPECIES: hypothetical protein [Hyphobacterium]|uniref:Tat pathway signal protein n=1 Tax=Hyphobacterium vulgare TaxID=1736751 RepID=A0ABV6ZYL3_9PROT
MKKGKISRRSFLLQVSGGALASGSLGVVTGEAWARQTPYVDRDPNDPVGRGRGGAGSYVYTGMTDADGGPNADPAGGGTGGTQAPGRNYTGITDSDGGQNADPVGQGRGGGTGITDADQGAGADAAGRGRGTVQGGNRHYTGLTDHDTRDERGYGGTFNVRDSDFRDGVRPPGSPQRNPRTGYSDQDPTDLSGRGTGGRLPGVSDNDTRDRIGQGRSTGRYTGYTDTDTGTNADRAGYGNGGLAQYRRYSGLTDSDRGTNADAAGYGRGSQSGRGSGGGSGYTGLTDADNGANADTAGYGRGSGNRKRR